MIPDGTYDAFIVDADEISTVDADERDGDGAVVVHLSVTILAGDHKGDVVDLAATGLRHDIVDLIGMPATLTVTGGRPRLSLDDR